jgi:hypothetical protein
MGVFRQPAMQTPVLVLNASYEPINICGQCAALAPDEDADAERDPAAGVSADTAPDAGAEPEEHSVAGQEHLSVLPEGVDCE